MFIPVYYLTNNSAHIVCDELYNLDIFFRIYKYFKIYHEWANRSFIFISYKVRVDDIQTALKPLQKSEKIK